MVLKFKNEKDEVFLVEAVGGDIGVRLNKWSELREFVGDEKFYEKVIHRHINFDRSDKMADNLDTFLNESIGHEYGLSASKLRRQKTTNAHDEHAH